jgi:small-conductance mechanosensitive channel
MNCIVKTLSAINLAQVGGEEAKALITEITTWKITKATFIILMAYWGIRATDMMINWLSEKVPPLYRLRIKQALPISRALILIVATVTVMNLFFNLSQQNLLAVTGTVAVTLGFAFKDYASSVIAGIVAIFEAPYRVGDRVQINQYQGEVITYGLRGIRIQSPDNSLVTIPHNQLWQEAITNRNNGKLEAQAVTDFYLAHEVDTQLVTQILYQAAYTSKYTQLKLPITVLLEEKPWGTHYQLKSYPIDAREESAYKTDLIKRTKQVFAQYDLTYPAYSEN